MRKKMICLLLVCLLSMEMFSQINRVIPCGVTFQYSGRDSVYTILFPVVTGQYTLDFSAESVPDGIQIIVGNDTIVPLHFVGADCKDSTNRFTCSVGPTLFRNRIGPIRLEKVPSDFLIGYDSIGGVARFIFDVKPNNCFASVKVFSNSINNTIWTIRMNCIEGNPNVVFEKDSVMNVCEGGRIFGNLITKDTSFVVVDSATCSIFRIKALVNNNPTTPDIIEKCDTTVVSFRNFGNSKIAWNDGDTSHTRIFTKPDTIRAVISNGTCVWALIQKVTIHKKPSIEIVADTVVEIGNKISLRVKADLNSLKGDIIFSPDSIARIYGGDSVLILRSQTIVASAIDTLGCVITDAQYVQVNNHERIFIPNIFSPNGDQNNDEFLPFGNFSKIISISIFNRWGEKIYLGDKPWNGLYREKQLDPDVFVYIIELEFYDKHRSKFCGDVTLVK